MVKKTTPQSPPLAATQAPAEVAVELPYPQIRYAVNNNTLDPIKAKNGTVATVAFTGMGTGPITLYWAIKGQDEPVFEPVVQPGSTSGSIDIQVPWQSVSTSIGHTVLVWYTARVAGQLKESLVLELEVQQIREADLKESLPKFEHAQYVHSTWQLDMKTFRGDETIRLNAWPMIQAGQRLFINVAGDQHKPPFAFSWVARDHVVMEAEAHDDHVFEFKLSRGWMARREDYSALTLHIAVIFDGTDPKPPVPVDPIYETRLPENAHEFHPRNTALLFVDTSLHLQAPILVEAQGQGQVDPLKLLEGATVRVCYEDMQSTDHIALCWQSTFGDCAPIAPQYGVEEGCIDFHVPPEYVGMRLDNFAHFSYTVTRDGEPYTSPEGVVRIPLPANLPQPQIFEAPFNTLDLGGMCCDDPVTVHVAPWPFIGTSQVIQLFIGGVYPDGSKARLLPFDDAPITEEDVRSGWTRTLSRAQLAALKHDSQLYVLFSVEFLPRKDSRPVYRSFPSLLVNLLTEPHLELTAPHLVESVDCGADGWLLNPVNTVEGAHLQVAYGHMCPGDWVCPTFTGTPGLGSPALECRTVGVDERNMVFPIPASAISANLCQKISVSYNVSRACGGSWESPVKEVQVLDLSGLPAPAVEQATGSTLDLNTFGGDATAMVATWFYLALGQPCWLWVTGELEDGSPYRFEVLEGQAVTEEWLAGGVTAALARNELQKLADCSAFEVHFAVNFNGESDKASAKEFASLTLEIAQEDLVLEAPTVREAVGSQLTVYNGRDGVTVRVAYDLISPGHAISVCWKRADGTCLPLTSKPGSNDPDYVDFHIPREAVIRGIGKTVKINYTVTSLCKVATSPDFDLHISVPVRLPAPVVPQATNNILDLRTFNGNADITVEPWWFILPDQKVWLRGVGTQKNGNPYTINVYLGQGVTAGEASTGLKKALQRFELELLKDLSRLMFTCKVTADGSTHESEALAFPILELIIRANFLTDFDDFESYPNQEYLGAGTIINTRLLDFELPASSPPGIGLHPVRTAGELVPGMIEGKALAVRCGSANTMQLSRLKFKFRCARVRFGYANTGTDIATFKFFGENNQLLGTREAATRAWVDFEAENGAKIVRIDVLCLVHGAIDSLTIWHGGETYRH